MFVNKDNVGFGSNGNKSLDGGNLASVEAKINYDAASRKVISDIDFTLALHSWHRLDAGTLLTFFRSSAWTQRRCNTVKNVVGEDN